MLMASDCLRKAAESIRSAEAATERRTREDFCRTAHAWVTLAEYIEQHPSTPSSSPPMHPADLATHLGNAQNRSVHIGDVLRKRLLLTGIDDVDLQDPMLIQSVRAHDA